MTKQQKTDDIQKIVNEARRWYAKQEFTQMVQTIWDGLEGAEAIATDGAPSTKSGVATP